MPKKSSEILLFQPLISVMLMRHIIWRRNAFREKWMMLSVLGSQSAKEAHSPEAQSEAICCLDMERLCG